METTIQQKIQVKQTPKVDVVGNRRNLKIKKEQSDILFAPAKSTSPANKSAQADQQQQIQSKIYIYCKHDETILIHLSCDVWLIMINFYKYYGLQTNIELPVH